MKSKKIIFIILILSIPVIYTTLFSSSQNIAYAHNFSGDESASFLTLIEEINTTSHIIEEELINISTKICRTYNPACHT
jgi:hypothetical protein